MVGGQLDHRSLEVFSNRNNSLNLFIPSNVLHVLINVPQADFPRAEGAKQVLSALGSCHHTHDPGVDLVLPQRSSGTSMGPTHPSPSPVLLHVLLFVLCSPCPGVKRFTSPAG